MFIDRESDGPARVERMPPEDVVESMLADMPSYGPEVNATHEKTIHSLSRLPAWQLRYRSLDDAIRLLSEIPDPARRRADEPAAAEFLYRGHR